MPRFIFFCFLAIVQLFQVLHSTQDLLSLAYSNKIHPSIPYLILCLNFPQNPLNVRIPAIAVDSTQISSELTLKSLPVHKNCPALNGSSRSHTQPSRSMLLLKLIRQQVEKPGSKYPLIKARFDERGKFFE